MAWVNRKAFCHLMKPLFWCMKIVGLLHGVPLRAKDTEENVSSSVKSCGRIYKIYAIIVILILWFNFALALSSFGNVTKFDGIVCNQIITTMWFFQIAYCSVCNFVVCKHLKEFCEMFDKVIEYINFDNFSYIRKCAVVATVLYVLWLMIAFTFTGLGSYFLNGNVAGPFGQVSPVVDIVMRIVFLITYFYFTSTWYLIMAPFLVISMVLLKAFKHFNKSFKQCFDNGKFKADIETTRMQHEQLTRVLAQADKVYSMYIMSSIGTVIPLIIFTLYFVLFESIDTFSYIATWWSACLSITQMLVIFLGGGLVNHEAHASVQYIYGVDMNSLSPMQCHQMNVFLSKLTANQIGFTAFGLFTIDKPTIIAFASSIVTYTVVVIQFKPSTDSLDSICNCTLTP